MLLKAAGSALQNTHLMRLGQQLLCRGAIQPGRHLEQLLRDLVASLGGRGGPQAAGCARRLCRRGLHRRRGRGTQRAGSICRTQGSPRGLMSCRMLLCVAPVTLPAVGTAGAHDGGWGQAWRHSRRPQAGQLVKGAAGLQARDKR